LVYMADDVIVKIVDKANEVVKWKYHIFYI
jgi:hypothetical protein